MQDKYVTKDQIKEMFGALPSDDEKKKLLDKFEASGFTVEGYNDQPQQSTADKVIGVAKNIGKSVAGSIISGAENLGQTGRAYSEAAGRYAGENLMGRDTTFNQALQDRRAAIQAETQPINQAVTGQDVQVRDLSQPGQIKGLAGDTLQAAAAGASFIPVSTGVSTARNIGKAALESGAIGAAYGGGSAMSAGKSNKEILADTLVNGLVAASVPLTIGGIANRGAAVDVVKNKLSSIVADKTEKKALNRAITAITPDVTKMSDDELSKLLRYKKVTPWDTLNQAKYIMSEDEVKTAVKYSDLLQSSNPVKNFYNIQNKVSELDQNVGQFLRQNNGIFNTGELKNAMKASIADINDLTVNPKALEKAKTNVVDAFVKGLNTNNMENLWMARKEFDRQIEKAFSGSYSIQKELKMALRNSIQDFIAERTPDNVYKNSMKEMSNLIRVQGTLENKFAQAKGFNSIKAWAEANPTKAKAIGATAATIGAGSVGSIFW